MGAESSASAELEIHFFQKTVLLAMGADPLCFLRLVWSNYQSLLEGLPSWVTVIPGPS